MDADKKKPSPIEKVGAFRCLNTSLELIEQSYNMMETARLLYPGMEPKFYDKIYKMAREITLHCPMHDMN